VKDRKGVAAPSFCDSGPLRDTQNWSMMSTECDDKRKLCLLLYICVETVLSSAPVHVLLKCMYEGARESGLVFHDLGALTNSK
jgi:hypothetical protein